MQKYFTGLVPFKEERRYISGIIAGAGWQVSIERSPAFLNRPFTNSSEIVIQARSFQRAQSALALILDAFTTLEFVNAWSDDFIVIPANKKEREARAPNPNDWKRCLSTSNLWEAASFAARASRRSAWAYALALYRLSTTLHANEPMDLDPRYFPYEQRSANLRDQVRFAYAIVTAYAVLETLGCALHEKAFKGGEWIPEKKAELEKRLLTKGVDVRKTLVWHLRGAVTKLEISRSIPSSGAAPWSRHPVRDQEVLVIEAIAYVRWLRARAAAHDLKKFSHLLSVHDVANAQHLARRLILNVIGTRGPNKSLQTTVAALSALTET